MGCKADFAGHHTAMSEQSKTAQCPIPVNLRPGDLFRAALKQPAFMDEKKPPEGGFFQH